MKYKIIKSNKQKGEVGKYQILEKYDVYDDAWRCCGVYQLKRDALEYLNALKEEICMRRDCDE